MTDTRTSYCVACKEMADRIEALEAENERLRVALREAIRAMDLLDQPDDYRMMWLSEVAETARAALGGKP